MRKQFTTCVWVMFIVAIIDIVLLLNRHLFPAEFNREIYTLQSGITLSIYYACQRKVDRIRTCKVCGEKMSINKLLKNSENRCDFCGNEILEDN